MFMNPTDGLKRTVPWSDRDTRGVLPIVSTRVWFLDGELLYTYYSPANKRCERTPYNILARETIGSMRTRSTVAAKLIAATFIPWKSGYRFRKMKRLISAKVYRDVIAPRPKVARSIAHLSKINDHWTNVSRPLIGVENPLSRECISWMYIIANYVHATRS